jgi:hypothetical protein
VIFPIGATTFSGKASIRFPKISGDEVAYQHVGCNYLKFMTAGGNAAAVVAKSVPGPGATRAQIAAIANATTAPMWEVLPGHGPQKTSICGLR